MQELRTSLKQGITKYFYYWVVLVTIGVMGKEIYNVRAILLQKKKKAAKLRKLVRDGKPLTYIPGMKSEFYVTKEWRELRWEVLVASDGRCNVCGRSKKDGVILHVDHIKPRSKFPAQELSKNNLQVLCADCNIGKGAKIVSIG